MKRVQFGIGFAPNVEAPKVIEAAQLAERLGFDVFWITDSHLASREAFSLLGALAVKTERIHLGPGVSHLAGRHSSVIASAFATLDELAPKPHPPRHRRRRQRSAQSRRTAHQPARPRIRRPRHP